MFKTDDIRIKQVKELLPPVAVLERHRTTPQASETVYQSRKAIENILDGKDQRLLAIVGPCSIHDPKAAIEYAEKLKVLRDELADDLEIVMRVYFEKPRTTVGWKGLINDPYLDESFRLNDGLRMGRKLLLDLTNMGIPTAVEFLDMITPQYLADLISWGAIGARTTESQVHRELSSGLSCPVGFKNGTDGNIKIATDAIGSASQSHHFLSVTKYGHSAIVETEGNEYCHVILRGGKQPNYSKQDVDQVLSALASAGVREKVMIDFSHANSSKQFKRQIEVANDVGQQIRNGNKGIFGVMIESHLVEGRQELSLEQPLTYGQSITDACLGWEDTEALLRKLADDVKARNQ
ncbi:3-deoxy-7-phosphoheptulonate synthase [Parashewanella curva]|uniref:Phospho-2-dehydro-3-deoxyheptonate aldolase n=1 Tax=Parashewanella curva TaxID=2338552 RepID=A0A3L8PYS4_9GAMM|nr:3-deoxy-7-phosphoheptulonate synthase AroG [Parashewanella curva]RLV59232.1 3-deoxy-7-phosphoheptulonate synthase [Parashewanella curva]